MVRVKICGITSLQDALGAVDAGADALGFVFYPQSPRYIEPSFAASIARELPPFVERVGLFVHERAETVDAICRQSGMSLAQIHWDVDAAYLDRLATKPLPVVRARKPEDLARFAERYRLVDAFCEAYGGQGKRLNLEWFGGMDCSKIVLAGGLMPDNVHEALKFGFYGVDVSSGVERERGVKDRGLIRAFIEAAKGGDCAG